MNRAKLPRVLGAFDVVVLAVASMGPAFSLATTMGPMVAAAGADAPLALVLLTAVMLCVAVAFSRLVAVMPNAGSSYSWIAAAFGPRAGAYGAWLLILANVFATLATALPAGTYTLDIVAPGLATSPLAAALVGTAWILATSLLLYAGARPTARVTAGVLCIELAVLGVTAVAAALHPAPGGLPALPAAGVNHGTAWLGGLVVAMVLGIWMSDGWEVSASVSEEIDGSRAVSGAGGIAGLLATSAVLVACMLAFLHAGTVAGFTQHAEDALAYVGTQLGSPLWRSVILAVVLVSLAGSLQTTMLYLSRSVYAMGRDGVLPSALGTLDRRAIPGAAIVTVTLAVAAFTLLTGVSPTAYAAYVLVLSGSAVFLGALFMLSAGAAARLFRADRGAARVTGVFVPLAGMTTLGAILVAAVLQSDGATRAFVVGGALAGVPFALRRRTGAIDVASEGA